MKDWERIRHERTDLTDYVIHFTKPRNGFYANGNYQPYTPAVRAIGAIHQSMAPFMLMPPSSNPERRIARTRRGPNRRSFPDTRPKDNINRRKRPIEERIGATQALFREVNWATIGWMAPIARRVSPANRDGQARDAVVQWPAFIEPWRPPALGGCLGTSKHLCTRRRSPMKSSSSCPARGLFSAGA